MKKVLFNVRSGSPLGIGQDGRGRLLKIQSQGAWWDLKTALSGDPQSQV